MNHTRRLIAHPLGGIPIGTVLESLLGSSIRRQPAARLSQPSSFLSTAVNNNDAPVAAASLFSACVFERLPVVMPEVPEWEVEYAEWREKFVTRRMKELPKEFIDQKVNMEEPAGQGIGNSWQPAPLETAADRSGDRRTTNRRLDKRIFLLVQRENGWEFPNVALQAGETTRRGAERALAETLGSEGFQPYFVGNAPAGHVVLSSGGTMVFHRCQLIKGKPAPKGSDCKDFVWVAKDELAHYVKDAVTLELLEKML